MTDKSKNGLSLRPFWHLPLFSEDIWGTGAESKGGLTVSEDESNVYVEAHLPGLKSNEIDLSFEKNVLWIRGEKKETAEDQKRRYYRRASTSFSYQVQIPGQVDEKKEPEASYREGVLKVTFTKMPKESQMKKISIKS